MNLIDRDIALYQLKVRADMSGGIAKTTFERAIKIVNDVPVVDVEEKKETPKWTPVKTKPKKRGLYLCYMNVGQPEDWFEECQYIGKGEWCDLDGNGVTGEVRAWMELPEKP